MSFDESEERTNQLNKTREPISATKAAFSAVSIALAIPLLAFGLFLAIDYIEENILHSRILPHLLLAELFLVFAIVTGTILGIYGWYLIKQIPNTDNTCIE